MAVVTAEVHDRATLVEELIEWQAFERKFGVNRCACFAGVILGANGPL
jgi:hypothetical protein